MHDRNRSGVCPKKNKIITSQVFLPFVVSFRRLQMANCLFAAPLQLLIALDAFTSLGKQAWEIF